LPRGAPSPHHTPPPRAPNAPPPCPAPRSGPAAQNRAALGTWAKDVRRLEEKAAARRGSSRRLSSDRENVNFWRGRARRWTWF
jgi:hypothetical protein